jgi:alkylhydroperoxidase/carboxymuconolactone decarboxylase family protein YurZ
MEKMNIEQLLQAMAKESGGEPETMKLLSQLNEQAVFEHAANKNFAMSGGQIPPNFKLLMNIAVSAALGSERCTEAYTKVALNKGIAKEDIVEALLLAKFVKGTTVMSASTAAMRLMVEK